MLMSAYDRNNIFAKILRGEAPCTKVYEDEFALAFDNIHPQAPIHVLVVPKGEYVSNADFCASAPPELIAGFWRAVGRSASSSGSTSPAIGSSPITVPRRPDRLPFPCPCDRRPAYERRQRRHPEARRRNMNRRALLAGAAVLAAPRGPRRRYRDRHETARGAVRRRGRRRSPAPCCCRAGSELQQVPGVVLIGRQRADRPRRQQLPRAASASIC